MIESTNVVRRVECRETNHLFSFITTPLSRLLREMFFDFVSEFKYFLQLNLTMAWSQLFKNLF